MAVARPLVVLADDNTDLRRLLGAALSSVGYRVVTVETGEHLVDAIRRLRDEGEALGVIITDVRMPNLGGITAARSLREAGHSTPIIFMTAYGDAWTRSQAAALGASLLDKPFSLGRLRQAVAMAVAS